MVYDDIIVRTQMSRTIGDYSIGRMLGEGTFGMVRAATHRPSGEQVAIKVLEKAKICEVDDVERVSRQIHILKLIRHPNIVQLYEIIETSKQLFLVMEYMEGGELFNQIIRKKRIEEREACRLFHQLLDAVDHIHKIGVTHRDLKPQNILLDYRRNIRLVDFGLSNTYRPKEQLQTPCGSPCYAAPQMIRGEKYDGLGVDVWSCGVILFAMLNGYLPFEDPNSDNPSLYRKILSGAYTLHPTVSPLAANLLTHLLDGDRTTRYNIPQIRGHAWMKAVSHTPLPGTVMGVDTLAIDDGALEAVSKGGSTDHIRSCLIANRHNATTTAYYLALKRITREYICCTTSDKENSRILANDGSRIIGTSSRTRKSTTTIHTQNTVYVSNPNNASVLHAIPEKKTRANSSFNQVKRSHKSIDRKEMRVQHSNSENKHPDGKVHKHVESKYSDYRQPNIENRISRKYKEQFNQSLVSRSREKGRYHHEGKAKTPLQERLKHHLEDKKRLPLEEKGRQTHGSKPNIIQQDHTLLKKITHNHIQFTKNKNSNRELQRTRINSSVYGPQTKRTDDTSILQDHRKKRKNDHHKVIKAKKI